MTLPTVGGDENTWGTTLNAHLNVGHNADGTHNQEDWTPTTYAGGESVTLPNGLILKGNIATSKADGATITFGTAFPNAILSVVATPQGPDGAGTGVVDSVATTGFVIRHIVPGTTNINWMAMGY